MPLTPSEQLTHSTVRIECRLADGGISTGTGFFYRAADDGERHIPVVVTNKHVVEGSVSGRFHLTLGNDEGPLVGQHFAVELSNFNRLWVPHPDPSVDLCAMPLGPVLHLAEQQRQRPFFITLDSSLLPSQGDLESLGALEDIIMIGYPNGIWDAVNNMPIVRRGVTATHPNLNYEGRKEFMIDAACFPGSSGSPVFLYNFGSWTTRDGGTVVGGARIKLLGVLYAGPQHTAQGEIRVVTVPTQQRAVAISTIPNNLGLIIKAERLAELDEPLRRLASGVAV